MSNDPSSHNAPKHADTKKVPMKQIVKRWLKLDLFTLLMIILAVALVWYVKPAWFHSMDGTREHAPSSSVGNAIQTSATPARQANALPLGQQSYPFSATSTLASTLYQQKILLTYLGVLSDELAFELEYHDRPKVVRALANRIQIQSLKLNHDPKFLPLQSRVNTLIEHVQALPSLEPKVTIMLFANLHDRIAELNLNLYPLRNLKDNDEFTEKAPTWRQRMLDKISNLIIIRHHENHIEPLLSPTQNFYLKVNLQLLVTQTEIAFQTENWSFALHNLTTIRENLQNYFDLTTEDGKQALQLLGQLDNLANSMASNHHGVIMQDLTKLNELVEMKLNEN